jgi:hypothetical protein
MLRSITLKIFLTMPMIKVIRKSPNMMKVKPKTIKKRKITKMQKATLNNRTTKIILKKMNSINPQLMNPNMYMRTTASNKRTVSHKSSLAT